MAGEVNGEKKVLRCCSHAVLRSKRLSCGAAVRPKGQVKVKVKVEIEGVLGLTQGGRLRLSIVVLLCCGHAVLGLT
jgi:hypothetical protein